MSWVNRSNWSSRTTAAIVAAALGSMVIVLAAIPVIDVIAGLALALILPGYALAGLLFDTGWIGRRGGRSLRRVERIVLVPALSLAVLVLGGLLLYAVHIRLTAASWAVLAGLVTAVAALVGPPRFRRASSTAAAAPPGRQRALRWRWVVPALMSGLLLAGAGWVSLASAATQERSVPVTELSMLQTATISGAPAGVTNPSGVAGRRLSIDVSTRNAPSARYLLVLTGSNGYRVTLTPTVGRDGEWQRDVTVPANVMSVGGRITAVLYRGGTGTPYRTVFVDLS